MESTGNSEQIKRLIRILKNLHDFELAICGYQSLSIFREVLGLVNQNSQVKGIKVIDINVSDCKESHDFQKNLTRHIERNGSYVLFNILGMEVQVKDGKQSHFLNNLNLQRELLADKFPYAFIFWLPENLIKRFALDAPDLWAWRTSVIVLKDEDKRQNPESAVLESYEYNVFSNFTITEKKQQLDYLLSLKIRLLKEGETYKQQKKLSTISLDIAYIYYLTGNYDKALKYFLDGVTIEEKLGDQHGLATSYNNIGLIYRSRGDYVKALNYYKDSLEIIEKLGNQQGLATSYTNISSIYYAQGYYNKALNYCKESLRITKELSDQQGLATLYNNIGLIYEAQGNHDKALNYYTDSLRIKEKSDNQQGMASSYNNIGLIYKARGDYDKALKYYNDSVIIKEKLGDQLGLVTSYNNIGLLYDAQGDYDKALTYFNKSKSIAIKIGANGLLEQVMSDIKEMESRIKASCL